MRSFALLLLIALTPSAWAQQTVTVQAQPVRVTVPDTSIISTIITNWVTLGNGNNPVNLSLSGLPAGVGATFDVTAFTTTGGANLTLNTTNVAPGEHVLSIDATGGAENHFLLTLQSGRVWTGTGDPNEAGNWSAPSSWVGSVPPGASDDVLFTQNGAHTNTAGFTNSVVDLDTTISSLRFSQTDGTARFHTLLIDSGRTLRLVGTNGFRLLRDYTGIAGQLNVNIAGTGGTMVVSNQNANIALLIDNQQSHTLDLSGLGTFVADVNRIGLGDYRLYPNYTNLTANGFGGDPTFLIPRRFIPTVRLARTNIIRAVHADPNNYVGPAFRDYSFTLGNNEIGTTADCILNLGISNAFFLDSICLIQSSAQGDPAAGSVVFNPAFATNNPVAYFRGTNGGRMSVFAIADAAGPGPSGTGDKAIVNLSAGYVDALVDRLYLARDRTNSSDGATAEATLTIAKGSIFDVNTAILGFQGQGNNQNVGGTDQRSYTRGTLNVSTSAVLVVNNTLELGHTTADPAHPSQAEQGFGQLNISNGATVRANTITVGGVTKVSQNNTITMTSGATLVVSNTLAAPDKKLASLDMADSTLTLHVDGANTNSYVYVTNLVTSGAGNVINIASVIGVSSYPAQFALISYEAAAPNFSVDVPPGLSGFIFNNAPNKTMDVVISTNLPRTLVWRGNVNGNWDTASSNWVDSATLAPAAFGNGDFVVFDDTATGPSDINVIDAVISGQSQTVAGVTVSNFVKNFSFIGGTIAGTGRMLKRGSGILTIDATSENSMTVSEGVVNGTGAIGPTTIAAGATLSYTGAIAGLTSSGTSSSAGTINGPVSIQGGTFVNLGTVDTTPGTMTIASGAQVTNLASGTLTVRVVAGNNWAIPSGSTLANFGRINNLNQRLNVNSGATLYGTGIVSDITGDANRNNGRLGLNAGAVFSPGSTVANSIGTFVVEGRLDLNQNARMIIEVDMNDPATNDVVGVDKWSNIRGIIVMTNIGTVPFAAGQSFLIASNNFGLPNTPETANLDYRFEPVIPGPGLVWDNSNLITNGILSIVRASVNPTPTNLTFTVSGGTNLTLSWPSSQLGWQIQEQTNSLALGISTNSADWSALAGSELTNQVVVPIDRAKPTEFYRLFIP